MGITPMQQQANPAGRLAHFIINWQKLTKDWWVLITVSGYKIDFITEPCQLKLPNPSQLNQHQQEVVSEEITEIISKGAISELQTTPEPGNGFFSTLFLVQKKDGGQRPVINPKEVKLFRECSPHQDGGISHTQKPTQKRGLVFEIDLSDAYLLIPISTEHRKYLCF
uniref:Reverse transcriptase domain-containing protein n=1 Tax=Amphimedon queenslandica TaxID=400682 RepID=A0A1X7SYX3_AMPQE